MTVIFFPSTHFPTLNTHEPKRSKTHNQAAFEGFRPLASFFFRNQNGLWLPATFGLTLPPKKKVSTSHHSESEDTP